MRFWRQRKSRSRDKYVEEHAKLLRYSLPPKIQISCCFCRTKYFNYDYHGYPSNWELDKFFQSKRSCLRCNAIIRKQSPELVFEDEECKVSSTAKKLIQFKNWFTKHISNIQRTRPSHKCFTCFSIKHETEFCEEKSRVPNFFLPKINKDLMPRFIEILNEIEKYLFGLSSETASKYVQMKPLIVAPNLDSTDLIEFLPYFKNANILVSQSIKIEKARDFLFSDPYPHFTKKARKIILFSITSKTLLINVKIVELTRIYISAETLLLILSSKTTKIRLYAVTITTAIKFSGLIKICPNVEKFDYEDFYYGRSDSSKFVFDNSWIENVLNNWKSLKYFFAPFKNLNLAPECLPFLQQKLENEDKVKVFLNFNAIKNDQMKQKLSNFSIELREEFIQAKKKI